MYKVIGNAKELTQEEWKALRIIGGSTVGGILGFSFYTSPYTIWEQYTTGERPDIDNKHTRYGHLVEPVLREWFAEEIRLERGEGIIVQENSDVMQSEEYDFLTGNIDGDIFIPELGWGVIEIKTASAYAKAFENGEIPDLYFCQIQYYMWLTDRQYGYMVWLKDKELNYQFIEREELFIENMLDTVKEFWHEYIEKEIPPPFTGIDAEGELIKSKYNVSDPSKIIDMPEISHTISMIKEIKEEIKTLEQNKAAFENEIKFIMGDAEVLTANEHTVTWKTNKNGRRIFKA